MGRLARAKWGVEGVKSDDACARGMQVPVFCAAFRQDLPSVSWGQCPRFFYTYCRDWVRQDGMCNPSPSTRYNAWTWVPDGAQAGQRWGCMDMDMDTDMDMDLDKDRGSTLLAQPP